MKTAGYWECRNEIIAARLPTPHKYEPFTELFNVDKLDAIRDKYGVDLYITPIYFRSADGEGILCPCRKADEAAA